MSVPTNTVTSIEQIGDGRSEGTSVFQTGQKGSFYGRTPIVIATKPTALGTVVFSAAYTGMWAFSSSTVAKAVVARIDSLGTKLKNLGLFS